MKKLLFSLALTLVAFTANAHSHLIGDVDGDGTITANDAIMIAEYILGHHNSSFIVANADVDRDGSITITDVAKTVTNLLTGTGGGIGGGGGGGASGDCQEND